MPVKHSGGRLPRRLSTTRQIGLLFWFALAFLPGLAAAQQQTLNLGTVPDDGTGDDARVGGDKINDNFTELYSADYLVGTSNGDLTGEIVAGTSPGGELGGTWGSPTVDDGVTVSGWELGASTATTPAANDNDTSLATSAYVQAELDDVDLLSDNCTLENDSTPIPDSCVGDGSDAGAAGGAPADADFLVGTANGGLSAEIVVGTSPGGELGGTWASPTVDDGIAITNLSLTSPTIAAGSASANSWPKLTAGTLLTAPEDGAIEIGNDTLFATTDAGNRGYVPVRHFIRANATRTLPNDSNLNAIFDSPTNGRLTLETGTYLFKMMIGITAMSATSGNAQLNVRGAGTATLNDWLYSVVGKDGTLISVNAVLGVMPVIESTPASMFTAGTGAEMWFIADGTFTVTVAGTLIPSVDQVTGAAAVVAIGSYFTCERIGDVNVVSVGQFD